jgi:hypothetical protein
MTIALYVTIWLSLVCFVAGEFGKRRQLANPSSARWTWLVWATGVMLAIVHSLLALVVAYDLDHSRAVVVAAERAGAVYGVAWRGSLYVNYVFIAWWAAETAWWHHAPAAYLTRPSIIEWSWRAVALIIWANGAVIFASGAGRIAGVPMLMALLYIWRPRRER